ncbi:hypothetical protein CRENBAI_026550 [Crenichthys baileyi]|uniref:Uncharacterized protein n=1 Tax=Crenichthys baileyi TaxID=28760 RepID=A0AAV9SGH2_9TELE
MFSRGSRGVPRTEPAFFISLLSFFTSLTLMLLCHQVMAEEITLSTTLIEDMQHLAANTERPKPPQKVQSALSLLVDGFAAASSLQSVVQVNDEIFLLLHHLHFFSLKYTLNYFINVCFYRNVELFFRFVREWYILGVSF